MLTLHQNIPAGSNCTCMVHLTLVCGLYFAPWLQRMGINVENLLVCQPDHGEPVEGQYTTHKRMLAWHSTALVMCHVGSEDRTFCCVPSEVDQGYGTAAVACQDAIALWLCWRLFQIPCNA